MRKFITLLVFLTQINFCLSQINTTAPQVTRPTPSVASLINYAEVPVDNFTGVPNINIPLYSFPTYSKDINVDISMGYHSAGISFADKASDTGLGWSMLADAVISRVLINEPDELYNTEYPEMNGFDDIYNYNFMGHSGRFFVIRDTVNNTFSVQEDKKTNLKIEYVMNPTSYRIDSFTIYDDKGYKFVFDKFDWNVGYFLAKTAPFTVGYAHFRYRSAHHLTKVYDNNGKELVNYTYTEHTKTYQPITTYTIITNKLDEISSIGNGKVSFTYQYIATLENEFSDPFQLNSITVKTQQGTNLKKYNFTYSYLNIKESRRILDKISELDKNLSNSRDIYTFTYKTSSEYNINDYEIDTDMYGYLNITPKCNIGAFNETWKLTSPGYSSMGVLEKMTTPTGGSIVYEFESNTTYLPNPNVTSAEEDEAFYDYDVYDLNTHPSTYTSGTFNTSISTSWPFTISGSANKKLFFNFEHVPCYDPNGADPNEPVAVYYVLKKNGVVIYNFSDTFNSHYDHVSCIGQMVENLVPGNYTIQVMGLPSGVNTTGSITITEKARNPVVKKWDFGGGIRIKKIAYYDTTTTLFPVREINYSYQDFTDPNKSSGEYYFSYNPGSDHTKAYNTQVGYRNVKVWDTGNNGYTKYYYKSYAVDNAVVPDIFFPYFFSYKSGLLKKQEVFDSNDKILTSTENTFDFIDFGVTSWTFDGFGEMSWAKVTASTSKNYFYPNGGSTPNIIETNSTYSYNTTNMLISESTVSNSQGETLKTKYYYHTGNSIHSKNRITEIEKVETYRGTELLSTSQINYGTSWYNNVSYLPNVITTSKGTQTLENRVRFNAYDEFSNPTEIQQEGGSVITYLWGYNKTQPIAKIENATNAQVATALGVSNVNLITEANITSIDALRSNTNLTNTFITTFTYLQGIGISTITDPKGDKLTYEYDTFNRLKAVKDKNNYILSENEYYYRANDSELNFVLGKTYKVPTTTSIPSPTISQAVVNKTFYDGLGRAVQQVAHQQSNTGKDIVTPYSYDALGRKAREFLPYVNSNASLSFNSNALTDQANYVDYTGQVAYSEKRFEQSPLNRVLEQAAPGNDWSLNNTEKHTIRFDYQTNETSDEVRYFKVTSSETNYSNDGFYSIGLPIDNGFYPINQLYKSITKNENWKSTDGNNNTSIEFKDKEGRVILKRTYGVSVVNNVEVNTKHDTYYIYDQYNNLTYVIPPLADGTITQTILDELCYQYRYDKRNRIVEKKLPAKQWEYIVYDKLDRIIAAGPTLSPFTNDPVNTYGWTITKYDALGRNIMSGWTSGTNSSAYRKTLQTNYDTTTNPLFESRSAIGTSMNNVSFKYTNQSLPTTNYHVLSVNYFDDYGYTGAPTDFTTVMNDSSQAVYYNNTTQKPKGLATGSWIRIVEASTVTPVKADVNFILYDNKARPVRHRTDNYLTGYTQVDTKIDFAGKVVYTETKHKRTSTDTELYTREDFTYSNQDRLVAHIHKIELTGTPQLLSKKEYNELGQVMTKRVGGTDITTYVGLQKVDYSYNIRGWLTGINKVDGSANPLQQGSDPLDLFGFKINYNSVENETDYNGTALYNGNISETYWRTSSDNVLRKYGYQYDDLNRLKNAIYQKPDQATAVTDSYNESMTYDKNGNIKALQRYGDFDDPITALQIDNLSYFYANNSNKLMKVTDGTNNTIGFKDDSNGTNDTADDYSYDSNGNMLTDQNKGIVSIRYNHLNLPTEIVFTGTNKKINYLYNSAGGKVEKRVTNGSTVTITDYLGGYQYTRIGTNGTVTLEFFPHAEGYVSVSSNVYNYVFNYTDHLGNNRLSFTLDPATQVLKILEENHYYPYGLKHSKYNIDQAYYDSGGTKVVSSPRLPYQYKYNGKELQDELGLNMYAMDMRQYDPAIGRWIVQDPVVHHNLSTYNAFDNNPVYWADPSGADSFGRLDAFGRDRFDERGVYISPEARGEIGAWTNTFDNDSESGWNLSTTELGGWDDLDKKTLLDYLNLRYPGLSTGKLENLTGNIFENAWNIVALNLLSSDNYSPNKSKMTGGTRDTVPDGTADGLLQTMSSYIRVPKAAWFEVKAKNGNIYNSTSSGQTEGHITNLAASVPYKFRYYNSGNTKASAASLTFVTTSDVKISNRVITKAALSNIIIYQYKAEYKMVNGFMNVRFVLSSKNGISLQGYTTSTVVLK